MKAKDLGVSVKAAPPRRQPIRNVRTFPTEPSVSFIRHKPLTKEWSGQDVFIIGGGVSLKEHKFDWNRLEGWNTLGINDAFRLEPAKCKKMLFGDGDWWNRSKWDLDAYHRNGGEVYSISPATERKTIPWVFQFRRINLGFSTQTTHLAWNWNTGAAAVNMAVLLGASRIFLLGFDMKRSQKNESHWHRYRKNITSDSSFHRFMRGFGYVYVGVKNLPVQIFNVSPDGSSKLPHFPKINFQQMEEALESKIAA